MITVHAHGYEARLYDTGTVTIAHPYGTVLDLGRFVDGAITGCTAALGMTQTEEDATYAALDAALRDATTRAQARGE